ncbi:MAG TPA: hypothetical protein VME46_10230 [Acidimicrobiales bacterium]|nr:hypothetical protein [Acidimicrobiales bacterium]
MAPPHHRLGRRSPTGVAALALAIAALCVLPACGSAAKPGASVALTKPEPVAVFDLRPEECLNPPSANPNLLVSTIKIMPCRDPHRDEVYCVLPYNPPLPTAVPRCPPDPPRYWDVPGILTEDYPGPKALSDFANSICLDEFQPYVGAPYTDSSLYYTDLYPSPQSWDDSNRRDRSIVCLLYDAGAPLTFSAKGRRL